MSLLLGARGKAHVVVMSDGFSILQDKKSQRVGREDLQKIFASKTKPYVVAHHGLNKIGSFGCDSLLPRLIADDLDRLWSRGLNAAIARVINSLDNVVSQHIKTAEAPMVFGLWLAGLWPCTELPEMVELVWFRPSPRRVRVDVKTHGDLVWGGSGIRFLPDLAKNPVEGRFELKKVFTEPPEYSMACLKHLYALALEKQTAAGEKFFGGRARMALVTEHGVDLGLV